MLITLINLTRSDDDFNQVVEDVDGLTGCVSISSAMRASKM